MSEVRVRRRRRSAYDRPAWLDRVPGGARLARPAPPAPPWVAKLWRRLPRRPAAFVLAALEAGLLAWLVTAPTWTVAQVRYVGLDRVSPQQAAVAAGLQAPQSVFLLDGESAGRGLRALPWVRSAEVQPELPNRVVVRVTEWAPVALYRSGGVGSPFYLTPNGVALAPAGRFSAPFELDGPGAIDPRAGQQVVDPALLHALAVIAASLPGLIGERVRAYQLDSCSDLTLVTRRGWQIQFGEVLTPAEILGLKAKLAAVKAVAQAVDLDSGQLAYVNVMNPSAPAIYRRSWGPPPPQVAAPSGTITINGNIAVQSCQ